MSHNDVNLEAAVQQDQYVSDNPGIPGNSRETASMYALVGFIFFFLLIGTVAAFILVEMLVEAALKF